MRNDLRTDRSAALQLLKAHKAELVERFDVARLALFGSEKALRERLRPDIERDAIPV